MKDPNMESTLKERLEMRLTRLLLALDALKEFMLQILE